MVFTFRTAQNPLIFPLWLVVGGVVWYSQQAPQDARLLGSPGGIDMLLSMTRTLPEKIFENNGHFTFLTAPPKRAYGVFHLQGMSQQPTFTLQNGFKP